MKKGITTSLCTAVLSLFIFSSQMQQAGAQTSSNTNPPPPNIVFEPNPNIPIIGGPKRTVSVGKFDAIGSFKSAYGGWDVGGGASAMMTTALKESGRFIVLERANIQQVLSEQEMAGQGVTRKGTGPELGKVTGAQFLIYGSVTEFGISDKGGGFSIGASGLGNLPFNLGLSPQSSSGKVAMDFRVVDTTTSEIIHTFSVSEPLSQSSMDLNLGIKGVTFGSNDFYQTPIGEATRRVINRAVYLFAGTAAKVQWTGLVVDAEGPVVYINAGNSNGVRVGDRFRIERVIKVLTDPQTGEILSKRMSMLGVLELTKVEKKMSYGNFLPLVEAQPKRGDIVFVDKPG